MPRDRDTWDNNALPFPEEMIKEGAPLTLQTVAWLCWRPPVLQLEDHYSGGAYAFDCHHTCLCASTRRAQRRAFW